MECGVQRENRADPFIESALTTRTQLAGNRLAASISHWQLPASFSARISKLRDDSDALPIDPPTC